MIELSERQQQIIRLSVKGIRTKFIAKELGLSPETIKSHIRAILKKTKTPRILWWKLLDEKEAIKNSSMGEWQPVDKMPKFGTFIAGNSEKGLIAPWVHGVIMNNPGTEYDWPVGEMITHFKNLGAPPPKGQA